VSGQDVLPLEVASHTALQYIIARAAPKLLAVRPLGMAADPAAQAVNLSFAVTTGAEFTGEVGPRRWVPHAWWPLTLNPAASGGLHAVQPSEDLRS